MFGMDSVADALTFDTESIAKGLDSGMATVGDAISKVTSSYEDKGNEITKAVSDGTDKTVNAINRLGTQMQGANGAKITLVLKVNLFQITSQLRPMT